jgi:hypothetical protein
MGPIIEMRAHTLPFKQVRVVAWMLPRMSP